MTSYRVKLATPLLESMTLATVEAFSYRAAKSPKNVGVETYGYIWGSKKSYGDELTVFFLDKLSVSLSAQRSQHNVIPNPRDAKLKSDIFKRFAPHQTLLADFHSHPYATHEIVRRRAGFEFSDEDFELVSHRPLSMGKRRQQPDHARSNGVPTWPRACSRWRLEKAQYFSLRRWRIQVLAQCRRRVR